MSPPSPFNSVLKNQQAYEYYSSTPSVQYSSDSQHSGAGDSKEDTDVPDSIDDAIGKLYTYNEICVEANTTMGEAHWNTIESDPFVFTELIKQFGASGVQVEELWNLDADSFEHLKPIHGLIFLFKWVQDEEPAGSQVQDSRLEKIFFAKQVIPNACATQAILSLLMNCKHPDLKLGSELTKFKEFTMSFDPKMRGLALSNSQTVRAAHNSMANQTLFEFDKAAPNSGEDAYHFVSYIPIDGRIYELDGLKDGPIDLGPLAPDQDWMDVARPIILKRMKTYDEGEIHFNLMTLVSDRKMIYERRLNELMQQAELSTMESDDVEYEISRCRMLIEFENTKLAKYQKEMTRRRHNYLPFIMELLKILAEKGMLMNVYEEAKSRVANKKKNAKT